MNRFLPAPESQEVHVSVTREGHHVVKLTDIFYTSLSGLSTIPIFMLCQVHALLSQQSSQLVGGPLCMRVQESMLPSSLKRTAIPAAARLMQSSYLTRVSSPINCTPSASGQSSRDSMSRNLPTPTVHGGGGGGKQPPPSQKQSGTSSDDDSDRKRTPKAVGWRIASMAEHLAQIVVGLVFVAVTGVCFQCGFAIPAIQRDLTNLQRDLTNLKDDQLKTNQMLQRLCIALGKLECILPRDA